MSVAAIPVNTGSSRAQSCRRRPSLAHPATASRAEVVVDAGKGGSGSWANSITITNEPAFQCASPAGPGGLKGGDGPPRYLPDLVCGRWGTVRLRGGGRWGGGGAALAGCFFSGVGRV